MSAKSKDDAVFKALGDRDRRKILDLLKRKPLTTGELCGHFQALHRCTVMQHLGVLEKADLVVGKKAGRFRWNYLNAMPIKRISDRWMGAFAGQAVGRPSRAKAGVKG